MKKWCFLWMPALVLLLLVIPGGVAASGNSGEIPQTAEHSAFDGGAGRYHTSIKLAQAPMLPEEPTTKPAQPPTEATGQSAPSAAEPPAVTSPTTVPAATEPRSSREKNLPEGIGIPAAVLLLTCAGAAWVLCRGRRHV